MMEVQQQQQNKQQQQLPTQPTLQPQSPVQPPTPAQPLASQQPPSPQPQQQQQQPSPQQQKQPDKQEPPQSQPAVGTNHVDALGQGAVDNGKGEDAPESDQGPKSDGLLMQDQQEMSERVAHLEKRVREQEDEIVCLKAALADVTRRLSQVESAKSQNSILPSKNFMKSPRRPPSGQERPKSVVESVNYTPRASGAPSHRPANTRSANMGKKWGSMTNSFEDTNGHRPSRPGTGLSQSKRSTSHGTLPIKAAKTKGVKDPTWNNADKYVRMHLKGRPVPLYAPSKYENNYDISADQDPPNEELKLEWVYGYRGRDCRSNLYILPTGEILYFTAGVVVLHNVEEQTQRHYLEHTDDIKCIAIHPNQVKIASGQVAGHEKKEGKPHVRIWDSVTLNTLHVIGLDDFERGVCCVSFSKQDGGKLLLAVDESNEHKLSIWDVSHEKKVHRITECKASGDPVTACEFHPFEQNQIVCCGKSQISFWTFMEKEKKLEKKSGIFEKHEKPKVIICFTFTENGDVVSGDSNGNIYVWGRGTNKISQAVPNAHVGGIFSLCAVKDGNILSGGKDLKIIQWDSKFQKTGIETELPENYGSVRMISQGPGNMLLVGTIRNVILQGNMDLNFRPVVEGHIEELWGLDTSPSQHQFLTCGYDGKLFMWDSQTHSCVWSMMVNEGAHCCSIHPNKDIAAVGLQKGEWVLIDLNKHDIIATYEDGKEQFECIQFSPDGTMLACGNRDNYIYVYKVSDDPKKFPKIGRCKGHSSFVKQIDWSKESDLIRSNSGDYEVLYWRAKNCSQETDADDVRDKEWATNNCTLCFNSLGIWPDGADGTDVNNCSASHNGALIASADDYGKVNLYAYPSIQHKATGHAYGGHSSHVTMAKFLCDDSRVISTGGRDTTIMQWQVVAGEQKAGRDSV